MAERKGAALALALLAGLAAVSAGLVQPAAATHSVVPVGLISWFNLAFCPTGWDPVPETFGTYIVGLTPGGTPGAVIGTPLANLENRPTGLHTHPVIDPGHAHAYLHPPVLSSTGSGASQAGKGSGQTSTEESKLTVDPYGVPGTNAPALQLLACRSALPGNVLPAGAVFFSGFSGCPTGSLEFVPARGRYIVGVAPLGTLGGTIGIPLADQEDRPAGQHAHDVIDSMHFHLYDMPVPESTNSGTSQGGVSPTQSSTFMAITGVAAGAPAGSVAGTNAPYTQVTACQSLVPQALLPAGVVAFFNASSCPAGGWMGTGAATAGRYLVGLPAGGLYGAQVGAALADQENRATGSHVHTITDPGHSHLYTPTTLTSSGSGGSKAGQGVSGVTWSASANLLFAPGGVGIGTNVPSVQYLACVSV